jgi:hypothetical protein
MSPSIVELSNEDDWGDAEVSRSLDYPCGRDPLRNATKLLPIHVAKVSIRRNFASREELILPVSDPQVATAIGAIADRGPGDGPAEVLLRALHQVGDDNDDLSGRLAALRLRLIRDVAAVRCRALQIQGDAQREIAPITWRHQRSPTGWTRCPRPPATASFGPRVADSTHRRRPAALSLAAIWWNGRSEPDNLHSD